MGLTPKQERNGIPGMGAEGGNVAQPGSYPDVAAPMAAAEEYGNTYQESGREAWVGGTAGTPGYSVADWDDNLAVTEGAGEV